MGRRLRLAMELAAALANLTPAHRALFVEELDERACEDDAG
ncbi:MULTISPECIES: hypothetical protein [Microbacterium]|nr:MULTISPECIES: hypothetical protein [Microbacterium]